MTSSSCDVLLRPQRASGRASVSPPVAGESLVTMALADCRRAFRTVALFSGVINVLMLVGPLYMLQIYDRVLASRSVPTLVALSSLLVAAYAFQGVLDVIRSRIVVQSAMLLDRHLGTAVHDAVLRLGVASRRAADAHQPLRDLDQIRQFLTGAGPIAIVDLPWVALFLAVCFLIHPWLGAVALAGAIVLFGLTLLTERASRACARALAEDAGVRAAIAEAGRRNSESVLAMGMARTLGRRWAAANARYLSSIARAADVAGGYASTSKIVRLLLQSTILGLGAFLVIRQELTAGAMIAASIMMGRALAPIESAIANWRSFVAARQGIGRLSHSLARSGATRTSTALPAPSARLDVEHVTVAAPTGAAVIVKDVRFCLVAGEALGVVGPSGAGKSSLARTLVGVWPPARGVVRIDGADLDHWDVERLGRHIGFVAQGSDLFDGTVAENIARMATVPDGEAVLRAARAADAHDMILRLPAGYDTMIGEAGAALSAGQRQRIALARALYGDPFLIVLDEPGANLDHEGEAALHRAVVRAKARGAVVVIVAHRPSALAACDKVLFLANGMQQAFGPRDEVLQTILARPAAASSGSPNLKVVGEPGGGEP
jgi:PrtD family type I secretion system ABC transporter